MKKGRLIEKYRADSYTRNIEVGDWVIINDGSYMEGIEHNSFRYNEDSHGHRLSPGLREDIFHVLAVNVSCPNDINRYEVNSSLRYSNNCVIKSLRDKDLFFCSRINIIKIRKDIDPDDLDEENINKGMVRDIKLSHLI